MKESEIRNMSITDRLKTMETIWDSLVHEDTEIESPDWHNDILKDRREAIENGTAKLLSLNELKTSLRVEN